MKASFNEFTDCARGKRNRTALQIRANSEALVVIADGSETDFVVGCQRIIDLVHTSVVHDFAQSSESIQHYLLTASKKVERTLMNRFVPNHPDDADSAVYLSAVFGSGDVLCSWIGSYQAKHYRNGLAIGTTSPHVDFLPAPPARPGSYVNSKILTTRDGHPNPAPDFIGPWKIDLDDILVIADSSFFHVGNDEKILSVLAAHPDSPAQGLVEWAQQLQYQFARAAVVIRFE